MGVGTSNRWSSSEGERNCCLYLRGEEVYNSTQYQEQKVTPHWKDIQVM